MKDKMKAGVYIHIPFCRSKCYYCDFVSFANQEEYFEPYKNALLREINHCEDRQQIEISSIFIGGGTPTVLPPIFLQEILLALSKYRLSENVEITVEANPGTLNEETLRILKYAGVNRLSIGLQAWQNHLLQKIGRIHTVETFLANYNQAVKIGFDNINVDLMFSLPEQTLEDWKETLTNIAQLNTKHISAYSLIIEDSTPFGELYNEGTLKETDENLDRQMYTFVKEYLKDQGFLHYEISNFAKPGFHSKHNVSCWKREDYLGFGLNAHSFFEKKRYNNTVDLHKYIEANGRRSITTENIIVLSQKDEMEEFMYLGLRLLDGVSLAHFQHTFNQTMFGVFGEKIKSLVKYGLVLQNEDKLRLTDKGIDLSNKVFTEFLL